MSKRLYYRISKNYAGEIFSQLRFVVKLKVIEKCTDFYFGTGKLPPKL